MAGRAKSSGAGQGPTATGEDVRVRLAALHDAMTAVFCGSGLSGCDVLVDNDDIREWAEAVDVPYLVGQLLRKWLSPADLAEWQAWPHREVWLDILHNGTDLWAGAGAERADDKAASGLP